MALFMSVAVDPPSETIYVMDNSNEIKVYYKSGVFKGALRLPGNEDGFDFFSQINFFNSNLFASQYLIWDMQNITGLLLTLLGKYILQI